jgi:RNA polymerase sigma factor (TIGR02999 family)
MTVTSHQTELVGELMAAFRRGDKRAAARLVEILYPELKRLAAARMRSERADHTWQPTVLVNELYMELIKVKALGPAEGEGGKEQAAFLGLASYMMRRLLIQHSRPLARRVQKIELNESGIDAIESSGEELREIENLLDKLAEIDPRLREVVEMKVFEGRTGDEIAQRLGCTRRSVVRYWNFASQWLREELQGNTKKSSVAAGDPI